MHDLRVIQKLNEIALAEGEARRLKEQQVLTTERIRLERAELRARLAELDELDSEV